MLACRRQFVELGTVPQSVRRGSGKNTDKLASYERMHYFETKTPKLHKSQHFFGFQLARGAPVGIRAVNRQPGFRAGAEVDARRLVATSTEDSRSRWADAGI